MFTMILFRFFIILVLAFAVINLYLMIPGINFQVRVQPILTVSNLSTFYGNTERKAEVHLAEGIRHLRASSFQTLFSNDSYRLPRDLLLELNITPEGYRNSTLEITSLCDCPIYYLGNPLTRNTPIRINQGDSVQLRTSDDHVINLLFRFI